MLTWTSLFPPRDYRNDAIVLHVSTSTVARSLPKNDADAMSLLYLVSYRVIFNDIFFYRCLTLTKE